ncbi:MAG: hypothetical protein ACI4XM_01175 [Candidatus Coprovivens sp.]
MKITKFNEKNLYKNNNIAIKNLLKLQNNNHIIEQGPFLVNSNAIFDELYILAEKVYKNSQQDITIIKNWIDKNYIIYNVEAINLYPINVILERTKNDLINIFSVYNIANLCKLIEKNKNINYQHIIKLKELTDKLELFSIVMNNSYFIDNKVLTYDEFLILLKNYELTEENKDAFCLLLRNALIIYIYKLYNQPYSLVKEELFVLFNYSIPKYYIYKSSDSIIGITYYALLNRIINSKINSKYTSCPNCGTLFQPRGNQKYCPTCIHYHIPKKIRDNNYEHSSKGKQTRKKYYFQKKKD